jgi:N6-L-threonylcarbamoyladenine synthase
MLLTRLKEASLQRGIKEIAIAGGVSANSGLRAALQRTAKEEGWNIFIPAFEYCTDNAAMIAIAAHYKFLEKEFSNLSVTPLARMGI